MAKNLSQFHQLFFDEARDHLAAMERLLLDLDPAAPDAEELNAIFRAAHSVKGGAATFGFADIAAFTHKLENILDGIRKGERQLRSEMIDVFLASGDALLGLVEHHQHGSEAGAERIAALGAQLDALTNGDAGMPPRPGEQAAESAPLEDESFGLFEATTDPAAEDDSFGLFEATAYPAAEDDSFGLFEPTEAAPGRAFAHSGIAGEVDDSFGLFDTPSEASPPQPLPGADGVPAAVSPGSARAPVNAAEEAAQARAPRRKTGGENDNSIRVGIEKVDLLINLVGELVITQSMLAQGMAALDASAHENLLNSMTQLMRNTRDLQEATMSMRMIPMNAVFSRFQRLVRDLSAKLGKKVDLRISGEQTELDKTLVEKLADPLTHLVRNSIDHGIETAERRLAQGKSETGLVRLHACHQGGAIVIEVSDDGAGLNRERILAKAAERGIPVDANASDAQVWDLIFAPGFSTAAEVTDVSGRGVGMDVVKRNIQSLGGRVEIRSEAGQGTRITIRLPLTLAILDGMSVAVGEEVFVLPLAAISESMQPQQGALRTIGGHDEVVEVRGAYLPVVKLHQVLNIPARSHGVQDSILVLLDDGKRRIALSVDALIGQQQFVIKSLETNFRRTEGFSGATILGDGRVAFILDTDALVQHATRH
ncbi:MAG: chemotaxis protein CheW [Pseudomonadota bacterium]|nr:chemotaxis protein CheW [Pseudomonadota bacterium]